MYKKSPKVKYVAFFLCWDLKRHRCSTGIKYHYKQIQGHW